MCVRTQKGECCAATQRRTSGDAVSTVSTGPDCWLILAGQSPRPSVQSAPRSWQSRKHTPERERLWLGSRCDSWWFKLETPKPSGMKPHQSIWSQRQVFNRGGGGVSWGNLSSVHVFTSDKTSGSCTNLYLIHTYRFQLRLETAHNKPK